MTPSDTRVATEADLNAIARTFTRAFPDDPVWKWLIPDPRRWEKGAPHFFRFEVGEHLPHQTVWVTPNVTAAAVWAPPGHTVRRLREVLSAPRMAAIFGTRSIAGLRFLAAMRSAQPPEPHWYLALLGTDPAHQGKGHGSAVLRPVLDRCDDEGLPAYLETTKEANLAYYRRHGFELQRELRPSASGPLLWLMWREPR